MNNSKILYRTVLFIAISLLVVIIIWNEQWELSSTPVIHDTIYSTANISDIDAMQSYWFSNGKYQISFFASKNAIIESRHSGEVEPAISEMRDFLSTRSYQQSTERLYNSPNGCNYTVFTGTYLSDPYCESPDRKCSYSPVDINKLSDHDIKEAYEGRGIRAKIRDAKYVPYPNYSIIEYDYPAIMGVCYPVPTITYARNDGRSLDFYIYNRITAHDIMQWWKKWAEDHRLIGYTIDNYPLYEYSSAIWAHYYYIELDDGDILSLWWYPQNIRIHRIL